MKPTAKSRSLLYLLLGLLPLLLIMLVTQQKRIETKELTATQSGPAVPFEVAGGLGSLTTTTTIPPTTTTTVPPTTTTRPEPAPTTTAAPSPPAPRGSVNWDAVAQCESGGNWSINTGNGYYGGLQMDMSFWRTYGNSVASRPDLASKAEQINAAERAYSSRGLSPWPTCGKYG